MLYAVAVLTNDAVISTYYKLPVPLQTCLLCSELPSDIDTIDRMENEEIISVEPLILSIDSMVTSLLSTGVGWNPNPK